MDQTPLYYESWTPIGGDVGGEEAGAHTVPDSWAGVPAPVMLCDGIGCDGYVWRHLRPELSDRVVVHGHYRGHGRSSQPNRPERVSIPDLVEDTISVLDDAQIENAVMVGHSMGVQVALETAHRYPSRVRGLILICGASSHPLKTFRGASTMEQALPRISAVVDALPSGIHRLARWALPTRLSYEVAGWLEIQRDKVSPADFMPYLHGMSRIDIRLFLRMLAAVGQHSADPFLSQIAVPTLVFGATADGFTPIERSRNIASLIPDAKLIEVENGSHTAPLEHPQVFSDGIREFLYGRVDSLGAQNSGSGKWQQLQKESKKSEE